MLFILWVETLAPAKGLACANPRIKWPFARRVETGKKLLKFCFSAVFFFLQFCHFTHFFACMRRIVENMYAFKRRFLPNCISKRQCETAMSIYGIFCIHWRKFWIKFNLNVYSYCTDGRKLGWRQVVPAKRKTGKITKRIRWRTANVSISCKSAAFDFDLIEFDWDQILQLSVKR